jgi:hypothetical protein
VQNINEDLTRAEPQSDITAAEGETVRLTVFFAKNSPPSTIRIFFEALGTVGSATLNADYRLSQSGPFFMMGSPVFIDVTLLSDGVAGEPEEEIELTLVQDLVNSPLEENRILAMELSTVTIRVQDNDIEAGFEATKVTVSESTLEQEVCLVTLGMPATDTVISVTLIPGTAGASDLTLITEEITISTTDRQPCVRFIAVADSLALEELETLTLSLSGPPNVQLSPDAIEICINDSDVVEFEFAEQDQDGVEGTTVITVEISRSVATAGPLSFELTPTEYDPSFGFSISDFDPSSPNTATPGIDYNTAVILFEIPAGSGSVFVDVPIIDDDMAENTEQYFIGVLEISGISAGATLGRTAILLSITDDDDATIGFSSLMASVDEQDVDFTYNLMLERNVPSEVTYSLTFQGSSSTAEDNDYTVLGDVYTFPPDVSSISVPAVVIVGDDRIELTDSFEVTLSRDSGPQFLVDLTTRRTTIDIIDDDGNYRYVQAESLYEVREGERSDVTFVLLNPPVDGVFDFDYNVTLSTMDGSATGGNDYMEIAGEVIAASTTPDGRATTTVSAFDDSTVEQTEDFFVRGEVVQNPLIADRLPVVFESPASVLILSTDVVSLSFETDADVVIEGRPVSVCLDPVTDTLEANFTVRLSVNSRSATEDVDYVDPDDVMVIFGPEGMVGSGMDAINGVVDTACIIINTITDRLIEGDEDFTVTGEVISNADLATFSEGGTVIVTIQDATVNVGLEQSAYLVSEGQGSVEVCVVVTDGTLFDPAPVLVTITDITATEGADYSGSSFPLTLTFSDPEDCATIVILDDDLIEMAEDFGVELTSDANFVLVSGASATVTIAEETAEIGFEQAVYMVAESDASVDVCVVVRNGRVDKGLNVSINVLPGSTAVEDEDFEFSGGESVIVIPPQTNRSCLTIIILQTDTVEGEEELRLGINPSVNAIIFAPNTTVAFASDGVVALGFRDVGYTIFEGETVGLVVQKQGAFESNIDFEIFSGATFVGGGTFAAGGEELTTRSVPFTAPDDDIALEDDETFEMSVTFLTTSPQFVIMNPLIPVVVQDNDGPVVVGFDLDGVVFDEGIGSTAVTVSLAQPIARDVTVNVAFVSGTAQEGADQDYVRTGLSQLVFTSNGTLSVPVGIVDDGLLEGEEDFVIELSDPQPADGRVVLGIDRSTVVIADNDIPLIGFEQTSYTTSEMFRGITVCVDVRNGRVLDDLIVQLDLRPSSATEGEDFDFESDPPVIEISAGGDRGCLQVFIIPSALVEPEEEINLSINTTSTVADIEVEATTIVILGDGAVSIGFASPEYTFTEGEPVAVVVQKSGPLDSEIEFTVTGEGGFSVTGVFPAGEAGPNDLTVPLVILDDDIALEPPELIVLNLTIANPSPLVVVTQPVTTVTILDDEGPVTVGFEQTELSVNESVGGISVAVSLLQQVAQPVSVDISYVSGSAEEGNDFFRTGLSQLVFDSPGARTIPLSIVDDDFDEATVESFSLVLSNPQPLGGVIVSPDTITINIIDNDETIFVGFQMNSLAVNENAGNIFVTVEISQLPSQPVTVSILYVSGTAVETVDFFRTGQSEITFTSSRFESILISIADDSEVEDTESFSISLLNPQPGNVVIFPDSITISIFDNDNITVVPFVNNTVVGDPFYTVPIELAGPLPDAPLIPLTPLCYEFHGEAGRIFNLVNDVCTLVNAHYTQPIPEVDINVIDVVTVRAKDSADVCRDIRMQLNGCSVTVDGVAVNGTYSMNDISVRKYPSRVRISVPNCASSVVMWMLCERGPLPNPMTGNDVQMDLIKFVLARGVNLNPTSHGVLGQMWNIPFSVAEYTGDRGFLDPNDPAFYMTIPNTFPDPTTVRTFVAVLQDRSWERTRVPCLYAGNRQAGPIGDIPEDEVPNESVIEGEYTDYIVTSEYASDCIYCRMFSQDISL